jgi:hypothetical protein
MRKFPLALNRVTIPKILLLLAALSLLAGLAYRLPPVHSRLAWRVDFALTYLRGVFQPAAPCPPRCPSRRSV